MDSDERDGGMGVVTEVVFKRPTVSDSGFNEITLENDHC